MKKQLLLISFFIVSILTAHAQDGIKSTSLYNGFFLNAGGTTAEVADTLYIGPGTYTIDGNWEIYSKYVWIHPDAQIEGSGKIIFETPNYYPTITGATTLDGNNGRFIDVVIVHNNADNILLSDVRDPGYGTVNPSGELAASLNIANNFDFSADNGDVLLHGNDLVFGPNASITNFSAKRMVVTGNSVAAHVVKENETAVRNLPTFTFPVGISEDDYTPATIIGTGTYHVSVINYAAAAVANNPVINAPEEGMNRLWHIYGGSASSITLQHNAVGIGSTNGTLYSDVEAFITRYQGDEKWSSGATEYISSGVHTDAGIIAASIPASPEDNGVWLTKASDPVSPLSIRLLKFEAYRNGGSAQLIWTTGSEQNNRGFYIERSVDGADWATIDFVPSKAINGNSSENLDYAYSDHNIAAPAYSYRLRQTDFDGKIFYSPTRRVYFGTITPDIIVTPNPAHGSAVVHGLLGGETIRVYSPIGQLVLEHKNISVGNHSLPLENLAQGIYTVRISTAGNHTQVQKLEVR